MEFPEGWGSKQEGKSFRTRHIISGGGILRACWPASDLSVTLTEQ